MIIANSFEELISLIKDRLDIVDVVSQYIVLKKSGSNYWGICPFHNDTKPSLSVSPSKGIYKCFSCGVGGDAINFLVRIQNREYKDIIFELAEKFGIELANSKGKESSQAKSQKTEMLQAYKKTIEYYNSQLRKGSDCTKAEKYLKSRDITDEVINEYMIGWAPNLFDNLHKHLKKDFSDEILEKAGLILKSNNGKWIDRFRNRIIIPIMNENGECVAIGARAVDKDQTPKYLNSADSLIYNKSKILFGLDKAKDTIKLEDSVIIMEGYFDVISAQTHGLKNCVASCGTALTQEHVRLISKYTKSRKIYLSFDTDKAGINATKKGSDVIKTTLSALGNVKQFDESHISSSNANKYSCEIRVVSPPQGKDPDEFIRTSGGEAFKEYIKNAPLLIDFLLNNALKEHRKAETPQQKAELVANIIDILKDINNKIIQSEYVKSISELISVDENSMLKELNKSIHNEHNNSHIFVNNNVTNSLQFEIKVQKNLLSVFLSNVGFENYNNLKKLIPDDIIQDETLIIVKNTIDKFVCTINNVRELVNSLYTNFIEDDKLTQILTDLVQMSEAFTGLDSAEMEQAVKENVNRIKKCYSDSEAETMRQRYMKVNNDDMEALKLQMQLRDKIKLRTGE